jgi:hypothetical protein
VMPRRSASCRSLASMSSGSFTVVRLMVCQHTASPTVVEAPAWGRSPLDGELWHQAQRTSSVVGCLSELAASGDTLLAFGEGGVWRWSN